LHNSYYAKFVNVSGDFDPEAEMSYPSQENYDFNVIQKNAKDDIEDIEAEDVTDVEKEKGESIRNIFLAKIQAQKVELEKRAAAFAAEEQLKRRETTADETPIARGQGRQHDELLKSQTKVITTQKTKKDYFTGAVLKKNK